MRLPTHAPRPRRTRLGWGRPLIGFLATLLAVGSALGTTAAVLQADGDDPSPARGHAAVIANGVGVLPADSVAWRVTSTAASSTADEPDEEALGFVLSDNDALLLNDLGTGEQVRLAAGEATFVAAGALQQAVALGDGSVDYYRIKLVPSTEVDDPVGGELVFAGEAFEALGGNRDLDLVRDVLEEDEEVELELGSEDAPAALLVTSGAIEIVLEDDADADPVELSAGEAVDVTGEVTIQATDQEGASFVAAVVGPEVPPIPVAETTPEPASVTVQALACPVAYEGDDFATDCVEPIVDVGFVLAIPATEFSVEGTTDANGLVVFEELGENTYVLTGGVPAEFAVQTVFCGDEEGPIPTDPTESEIPGAVFEVAAGDEITCSWYVVPEDLQGEPATPVVDTDGDGLSDEEEAGFGTDPTLVDTDQDRLSDGSEVLEFGTDPLLSDSDEDGLGDGDELEVFITNPLAIDSDEDGVDDPTEINAGTDPNDPASA